MKSGLLQRYREFLPITEATPVLSLGEGDTPLLAAPRLARWVGVDTLYVKFEGSNPTGSFKDRGMVVAVARAVEGGACAIVCASTGNTAASAAAYAARAGCDAVVVLPQGTVAQGKLGQALACGARVVAVDTGFDESLDLARALAERYPVALVNSVNPDRIDGQATAAYEICDVLGGAPEVLTLPVGNGGNVTAYWRGFRRYHEVGRTSNLPRLLGVQAAGAAPLVHGEPVSQPDTVASAIRIGRPASWDGAVAAVRESGGEFREVTDEAILDACGAVARCEGLYCEPASAAAVAGLRAAVKAGTLSSDATCVAVLTGHGLKDPERALAVFPSIQECSADQAVMAELLGLRVLVDDGTAHVTTRSGLR